MSIDPKDLFVLKLRYTPEEFSLLELADQMDPKIVDNAVDQIKPNSSSDTAAWDRVICSLFAHARDHYEGEGFLPPWAEKWFENYWPDEPFRNFCDLKLFDRSARFKGLTLVSLY